MASPRPLPSPVRDRSSSSRANGSQMSSRSASGMPGDGGILFGSSRKIADRRFGDLTGWQLVAPAAESLAELTSHESC